MCFPEPVRAAAFAGCGKSMITLTLIVPVYNEEKRIQKCIQALCSFKPPKVVEIDRVIFVDDGSEDNSKVKIQNSKSKLEKSLKAKIKIISYKQNKGRGYALREGMKEATGDYALWLDADMSTPLSQIEKILPSLQERKDVVIGSRKIKGAIVTKRQPFYRIILGQGFSKLSEIALGVPVGDFTCGFKAFTYAAYKTLFPLTRINGWGNDSETLFLAQKYGFSIAEIPILWRNDPRSRVRVIHDIFLGFWELYKIRYFDFIASYRTKPDLDNVALETSKA